MLAAETRTVTVVQGDYRITDDPAVVLSTILGSCVTVCMFDAQRRIGGMNHFLLPGGHGRSAEGDVKYGVHAMELLINGLLKEGALRANLQAKIFGASAMSGNHQRIGESNGAFAVNFLQQEGIPLISQSLGGTNARRVRFHPTTGKVQQYLVPIDTVQEPVVVSPPARPAADITFF